MSLPLHTIDVAHPPRSAERVETELIDAWTEVRNSNSLRLLKIVHGYGRSGKGGSTREVVRNWAYRNRGKFWLILEGENYSLASRDVQELRKEIGDFDDFDLRNGNPGVILLWVK